VRHYRFKALSSQGQIVRGKYEAISSQDLKAYLHQNSLLLISYSLDLTTLFPQKVKARELIDFCIFLEQFEAAGISLKEGLEDMVLGSFSSRLKGVLKQVLMDVEGGHLLSHALEKHREIFNPVFIGLISVGEKTGRLSLTLNHLHTHLTWMEKVHHQTLKSLRYPCLLIVVMVALMMILMTTMVPEMIVFLRNFSTSLPLSTQILITISTVLTDYLLLFLGFISSLSVVIIAFCKFHPKGELCKDMLKNRIPLLGPLRKKIELSRFCHMFSILYGSGIDVLEAFRISRSCLSSAQMIVANKTLEKYVNEGLSLSQAFEKVGYFPKLTLSMIKMGEKTSCLEQSLMHMNTYFEAIIKKDVDALLGYIEPSLILCMGLFMAWIILSVFLPLYDTLSLMDI
jgi:type IV pilus assembly protein PilC